MTVIHCIKNVYNTIIFVAQTTFDLVGDAYPEPQYCSLFNTGLVLLSFQMEKLGLEEEDCRMRVSCEIGRQNSTKIIEKNLDQRAKFDEMKENGDKVVNEEDIHQSFNLTMSKALMKAFT